MDFVALAQVCAPTVAYQTMQAIVSVESSHNPHAIGVVGGRLERQPTNKDEAVATAKALMDGGWNFSVGIAQVNRFNWPRVNLTLETAFDPCENLRAGAQILQECYQRAPANLPTQQALQAALSCYYSGNFSRGFKPDSAGEPSYVQKVVSAAKGTAPIQPDTALAIPIAGGRKAPNQKNPAASVVTTGAATPPPLAPQVVQGQTENTGAKEADVFATPAKNVMVY